MPTRANARPDAIVVTEYDQTAGLELPALFTTSVQVRGAPASMMNAGYAQATDKQKREVLLRLVRERLGDAQVTESRMDYDAVAGIATVSAKGCLTTQWSREDKRMRIGLDQVVDRVSFDPDRSRPAWRAIPVATGEPDSGQYKVVFRLPQGGRGFVLEGDQALATTLAGVAITRKASLDGGIVTVDERADATGGEIAPEAIAGERSKLALAKTRSLRAVAPADLPPRWRLVRDGPRSTFAALDAAMGKAIALLIADDPTETSGYESRLSFRRGIYDYRGAIEDATKLLAIGETADRLVSRSSLYSTVGDTAKALADAEAATKLDPGSLSAVARLAVAEADAGRVPAALARLKDRIDQGGKDRFPLIQTKAELQARHGDADGAIAMLDAALVEKPGDPLLLNSRCWIKGTTGKMLDTALKDCTKAIELADSAAAALDSRAMVYWKMNRAEEALADLDAALDTAPAQASSLYLRGVIRKKAGNAAGAADDLSGARLIDPQIDKEYAKYGVVP